MRLPRNDRLQAFVAYFMNEDAVGEFIIVAKL